MTSTPTTAPLAVLPDSLYAQAAAATSPALASIPRQERDRLLRSKTDYLDPYGHLKDLWLPVPRQTGVLLYLLARSANAHSIVGFGTSFGLSTLHLAAAPGDNGGGLLLSSEFEPSKGLRAHIAAGGLAYLLEIRDGDALQTLNDTLPDIIVLLLLDGAKALNIDIVSRLETRLRPGALIIADDAHHNRDDMAYVRTPANSYLSVACGEDIELSMRLH